MQAKLPPKYLLDKYNRVFRTKMFLDQKNEHQLKPDIVIVDTGLFFCLELMGVETQKIVLVIDVKFKENETVALRKKFYL